MSLATPELEPVTGALPPDMSEVPSLPGPEAAPGMLRSYRAGDGQLYPLGAPQVASVPADALASAEQSPAVDGYVGRYGALVQERDGVFASLEAARGHSVAFFDAQLRGVRSQYLNELHDPRPAFRATARDRYERRMQDIEAARGLALERADAERERLLETWNDATIYQRAMMPPVERRSRVQSLLHAAPLLTRRVLGIA